MRRKPAQSQECAHRLLLSNRSVGVLPELGTRCGEVVRGQRPDCCRFVGPHLACGRIGGADAIPPILRCHREVRRADQETEAVSVLQILHAHRYAKEPESGASLECADQEVSAAWPDHRRGTGPGL